MKGLATIVLQRLALGFLTLWIVSVVIFSGVQLLPGDVAETTLGQFATPETVAAFRRELNLDAPSYERYLEWLVRLLHGDLGRSFANGADITSLIAERLYNTVFLASLTAILAIPLGIFLGLLGALFRNSLYDRSANATALILISLPEFFIAYVLILFFSIKYNVFPSISSVAAGSGLWQQIFHTVLPSLTLTVVVVGNTMRMCRAAVVGILAQPYIEMATLSGFGRWRVIARHALANAWGPIIVVVVVNLAYLIVGVVIVEAVFVYPGLGQLLVDAVSKRDITVVQACSLIFAGTYVLLNMLADILSIASNPRLLHGRG